MPYRFSRLTQDQHIIRRSDHPQHPLVSVIMPTYKLREGMNQRAIESVLNQTFTDFEFVIVDDGSMDGLAQILADYQQKDARILLVQHAVNCGLPGARVDEGVLLAQGKYLAYMFEDDMWYPQALEHLLETMRQGPDTLVYGIADYDIYGEGGLLAKRTLGDWDFDYATLKESNKFANCAVLHPKSLFDKVGLYDPNILIRRHCDYDLWLRMARVTGFQRCPHVVARVESGTRFALGSTVQHDIAMTYRYINSDRSRQLLPGIIQDYAVDVIPFQTHTADAHRIREHYIIPFWVQHPALLTAEERKLALASRPQPNRLLATKSRYSTSVDVTLGNFSQVIPDEVQSLAYLAETYVPMASPWSYDTLILYRTIAVNSLNKLMEARRWGKSSIYLMDDNMFRFGTGALAEQFQYLKPETTNYHNLEREVREADLVLSYSPYISDECRRYNPRVVELSTNIRAAYIHQAAPLPGGRTTGRRIKYAVLSGPARKQELTALWTQLETFFNRHKDEVEFHLWGMPLEEFGQLTCPVVTRPFDYSYESYLNALATEQFDYVICPLFDDHETKIAKSPVKFLEATAGSAVGIYSDSVVYQVIQNGVNGLIVKDNAWLEILESSLSLPDDQRRGMHAAAKAYISQHYTTESQVLQYLSVFEAADLHAGLESQSAVDGRAAIAYCFHETLLGGATLHLMQHALIAKRYGFRPILCFPTVRKLNPAVVAFAEKHGIEWTQLNYIFTSWKRHLNAADLARAEDLGAWMLENGVRLVHMVTYIGDLAYAAQARHIPVTATLHQYYDPPSGRNPAPPSGQPNPVRLISVIHSSSLRYAWQWQTAANAPAFCIRAPIADEYFNEYTQRCQRPLPGIPTLLVSGTIQQRKGQLEAIRAVGKLINQGIKVRLVLLGYDHLVEYVDQCRKAITDQGLEDFVSIAGFADEPQRFYQEADFILCSSDDESMPQSILKAMASGIRAISTPAGGVRELILDGFSGIIANSSTPEDLAQAIDRALHTTQECWEKMLENAHLAARMTCHPEVVTYQLLKVYNRAVSENKAMGGGKVIEHTSGAASARPTFDAEAIDGAPMNERGEVETACFARRMNFMGLSYRFRIPRDNWDTLVVTFGTYGYDFHAPVKVTVHLGQPPFTCLVEQVLDGSQIVDNLPHSISFPAIADSAEQTVVVRLRALGNDVRPQLAIYERGASPSLLKRLWNLVSPWGGKLYGLLLFTKKIHRPA